MLALIRLRRLSPPIFTNYSSLIQLKSILYSICQSSALPPPYQTPCLDRFRTLPHQLKWTVRISTLLKELTILSTINKNANTYILQNGEAILSPYRNLLTPQNLYKLQKTSTNSIQNYYNPISQKLEFKRGYCYGTPP